jgi:hypothetical protein
LSTCPRRHTMKQQQNTEMAGITAGTIPARIVFEF